MGLNSNLYFLFGVLVSVSEGIKLACGSKILGISHEAVA
jgi:hypothetical protein